MGSLEPHLGVPFLAEPSVLQGGGLGAQQKAPGGGSLLAVREH